jgi:hypothetical protein
MAYFCPNCGEPVKNAARFCESCGARLREDEPDVDLSSVVTQRTSGNVQYQEVARTPVIEDAEFEEKEPQDLSRRRDSLDTDPYREYQRHTYDYKGSDRPRNEYQSSDYRRSRAHEDVEYFTDPSWPVRNRIAAGVLAIMLGSIGVHKFYLGKIWQGLMFLLFFWTGIPAVIGFVQGIIYLTQTDEEFCRKNHVRTE